jgi:hypothetical protein
VLPVSRGLQLLESASQLLTHKDDTLSNTLELCLPFVEESVIVEDLLSNAGTSQGRTRVVASDDHLELTQDLGSSCFVRGDHMDGTSSETIKTHILGITLGDEHIEPFAGKIPDGFDVLDDISTGKALVGGVEEWNQLLLLHHFGDGLPVFRSGVYSGGVMSAGVKKYNGSCLGFVKESEKILQFYLFCDWVIVGIVFKSETCTLSYAFVVGPGRSGDENLGRTFLTDQFETNAQGASARDRLCGCHSAVLEQGRVLSEDQFLTARNESRNTINGDVFLNKQKGTMLRVLSATSSC